MSKTLELTKNYLTQLQTEKEQRNETDLPRNIKDYYDYQIWNVEASIKAMEDYPDVKNGITDVRFSFSVENRMFYLDVKLYVNGHKLSSANNLCFNQVAGFASEKIISDKLQQIIQHVKQEYGIVLDSSNVAIHDNVKGKFDLYSKFNEAEPIIEDIKFYDGNSCGYFSERPEVKPFFIKPEKVVKAYVLPSDLTKAEQAIAAKISEQYQSETGDKVLIDVVNEPKQSKKWSKSKIIITVLLIAAAIATFFALA